jgi:thiol-disulfide isomerase/thioredoxin
MPKSARFAGSFLSVLFALSLFAADLRPVKDPGKIVSVFPSAAKVRVLNFWAIWCAPCVAEMPDLRAIDEAFGEEVALVGVSLDDMLPDAKSADTTRFLDKQMIAYPNVYYTGNMDDLIKQLKIDGDIPVTIVFDAKGNELWRHRGLLHRTQTIARLRENLRRMQ